MTSQNEDINQLLFELSLAVADKNQVKFDEIYRKLATYITQE